jgi:hypothetical protein
MAEERTTEAQIRRCYTYTKGYRRQKAAYLYRPEQRKRVLPSSYGVDKSQGWRQVYAGTVVAWRSWSYIVAWRTKDGGFYGGTMTVERWITAGYEY